MTTEKHKTKKQREKKMDDNRDPISGAPGAHPLGTGVGAAAGGVAGAAVAAAVAGGVTGTAVAGPAGTVAGAAIGAVVGGLAGKGVAENVNPTAEDAYWREQHRREPYYDKNYSYQDYQGAYRTGYEGYHHWGGQGKSFEEAEAEMRREYEMNWPNSKLSWEKARPAARAAWSRFDRDLSQYIGYTVVDRNNAKIGTLECLWSDHKGEPAFIGVRSGWIFGSNHVVPAQSVTVSERSQRVRLPYDKDRVKDAPTLKADSEMSSAKEGEVCDYYGVVSAASKPAASSGARPERPAAGTMQLSEEQLKVGKREVEAGGVRLRKVVRVETVDQPVQLQHEEVVIERVPPESHPASAQPAFSNEEVYIPLRREEAVIEKEPHVREEVHFRKQNETNEQRVSENVRREDIEVEKTGQARRGAKTTAEEIRGREEVPRSQRRRE